MIGEYCEIICHDGAEFCGWVDQVEDLYVVISGRGFPWADVKVLLYG